MLLPLVALLAWPAGAAGHAVLTHSTPHRGQTVEQPAARVQFDFNEPVEVGFGSIRVYDEEGEQVDDGDLTRPGGSSNRVAVGLDDGLGDGVYTGTFRVVSADGHPVSGGFSFVGEALPTGGSAPTWQSFWRIRMPAPPSRARTASCADSTTPRCSSCWARSRSRRSSGRGPGSPARGRGGP